MRFLGGCEVVIRDSRTEVNGAGRGELSGWEVPGRRSNPDYRVRSR
jgi:hypothetical protein